jgi:hypothetical protein
VQTNSARNRPFTQPLPGFEAHDVARRHHDSLAGPWVATEFAAQRADAEDSKVSHFKAPSLRELARHGLEDGRHGTLYLTSRQRGKALDQVVNEITFVHLLAPLN